MRGKRPPGNGQTGYQRVADTAIKAGGKCANGVRKERVNAQTDTLKDGGCRDS